MEMRITAPIRTLSVLFFLLTATNISAQEPQSQPLEIRELRLEIREMKLDFEERIASFELARNAILTLLGINILSLFAAYWRWVRKADELVEKHLDRVVESRPGTLLKLIDQHDVNQRLRRETHVTIVSKTLELEGVLRQHGFKRVKSIVAEAIAEPLAGSKAVIIDLVNGVDEKQAAEIIALHGLEHVLAFCYGRANLPPGVATFANSHMTLFSRLEELLRYQDATARG
jgi:hypothetical protein